MIIHPMTNYSTRHFAPIEFVPISAFRLNLAAHKISVPRRRQMFLCSQIPPTVSAAALAERAGVNLLEWPISKVNTSMESPAALLHIQSVCSPGLHIRGFQMTLPKRLDTNFEVHEHSEPKKNGPSRSHILMLPNHCGSKPHVYICAVCGGGVLVLACGWWVKSAEKQQTPPWKIDRSTIELNT